MGEPRRPYRPRRPEGDEDRRRRTDAGSSNLVSQSMAIGPDGRILAKLPEPSAGERFGELTVVGVERKSTGGVAGVRVRCSCKAEPYLVDISNLRKGASTRCNACAKQASKRYTKQWYGYSAIVPDDAHRRRLCNRIAACNNRCHNPKDTAYPNYGGRGIRIYEPWRADRSLFLAHLVTLDGWDDPVLELDREDVNEGYEPGNLRFITKRANRNNQRSVRELQARVDALEARLRYCKCGA
jgi:hypothetical protein